MTTNTCFIESLLCYLIYLNTDVKLWLIAFYVLLVAGIVESILDVILKALKRRIKKLEDDDMLNAFGDRRK